MLTINIMKLEVNSISNIGSLNIGKSIICQNRAVSKEITNGGSGTAGAAETGGAAETPTATSGTTPLHPVPPVHAVPPTPTIPPATPPVTPTT